MLETDVVTNEIRSHLPILVVEDDQGLVHLIQKRLERDGYNVLTAFSGHDAIDIVKKEPELLLLLDYKLGDMSGSEVIDSLTEKNITLPFIIMTGHGDERIAVEMMKLGAMDYLVKDDAFLEILPRVLSNVMRQLLTGKKLSLAKLALHESEKRFRMIFNSGTDAIFLNEIKENGRPGRFIEVNDIAGKRLGYTREELLQKTRSDIIDPMYRDAEPSALEALHDKSSHLYEMIHLTKGGKRIPVEVNSQIIDFEGQQVFLSISRDITERKSLEEQLRQAQKMEAIGKLAGGVAHDFNNLLTTINGYAELMLIRMDEEHPLREGMKRIKKAGERAATLTQQLLTFGRKQMLQPEVLDINNMIRSIEKMLKKIVGDEVTLVVDPQPEIMNIKADPGLVEQIILNLTVNASDAMKKGGQLLIKTENKVIDEYQSTQVPGSRPGRYICLSISDSGDGMDGDTIKYIFEPFFSTKEVGTGLGLAVVYGIIKQHNGWINVYSEPGKGTIFRVYLPSFNVMNQPEIMDKDSLFDLSGNGEKILFVEDEDSVRNFSVQSLRANGYQVIEALNVREAIEIFEKQEGNFELCLSDSILPDRTGVELAEELLAQKPDLKVLISSHREKQPVQYNGKLMEGLMFLQKPYSLTDLLGTIKGVLK